MHFFPETETTVIFPETNTCQFAIMKLVFLFLYVNIEKVSVELCC